MMSETPVIENAKGALKNAERVLQAANEQIALLSTSPGAKAKGVEQITQPVIVPASAGKGVNKGAAKSRPPPPPPHRPFQNTKKLLMARIKARGKQRSTNGAHLNQTGCSRWRPPSVRDGSWNQDVVYGRPF